MKYNTSVISKKFQESEQQAFNTESSKEFNDTFEKQLLMYSSKGPIFDFYNN